MKLIPPFAVAVLLAAAPLAAAAPAGDDGAAPSASLVACAGCHGVDGNAGTNGAPNIGGQKPDYLYDSLMAYKTGARTAPSMQLDAYSAEELAVLAAYYGARRWVAAPGEVDAEAAARGQHVAANCLSCHGIRGLTVNSEWPNIAGQRRDYLEAALTAYRSGERQNTLMYEIVKNLTDEQLFLVANYYASLPVAGD